MFVVVMLPACSRFIVFLILRRPPRSTRTYTLFPYTTLFRSDSDKLDPSGPERYAYAEHRDYLDALWEALDLGDRVVLVVHDLGSVRSEEHTSELQSLMRISYDVFCLKKKKLSTTYDLLNMQNAIYQHLRIEIE